MRATRILFGLQVLLLSGLTIGLSAAYLLINVQYQQGEVNAEAELNAQLIAHEIASEAADGLSDPVLSRFVDEDIVFRDADEFEAREIAGVEATHFFKHAADSTWQWPMVQHTAPIEVAGERLGYFNIQRTLTAIAQHTAAIFGVGVLCSIGLTLVFRHFVVLRLQRVEDDLSRQARFDALTGLPNRRHAIEELSGRLARIGQGTLAVFFIDLDKFKAVNDSYGHAVGDALLRSTATRLKSCVPPGGFLARLAGDEFILVLPLSDPNAGVNGQAEAIAGALSLPQRCLGHDVAVTATVGVALAPAHAQAPESLLQCADTAMYAIKHDRRGEWKLYHPQMKERIDNEVQLRTKLRHALHHNQYELHYQPLVHLHDGRAIGAEALIRWRDPSTGKLVSPLEFIPELESSGLIVPVGEWVLRTACKQVARWRQTTPKFHVAVNVSARQFLDEGFVEVVARVLREENVPAEAIEVELTESVLFDEVLTTRKLEQLKTLGVRLSLDDFGTGFSSLGRLSSMPFDVIKIDRRFIENMNQSARDSSVVVSIVALTHGLGMTVLSEGIESDDQLQALLGLGCERGQGFLFSKPLTADRFTTTYIDNNSVMCEE
jgi:diguanylate cyclase (GGDEF)-like protein